MYMFAVLKEIWGESLGQKALKTIGKPLKSIEITKNKKRQKHKNTLNKSKVHEIHCFSFIKSPHNGAFEYRIWTCMASMKTKKGLIRPLIKRPIMGAYSNRNFDAFCGF